MIAAFALIALAAVQEAPAADPAERQIADVIERLHQAASAADGAAYFDLFAPDARFIGTDATERWSVAQFRAYAEPFFAQGRGWTYRPGERTITVAPIECRCVAWFDETLWNDKYGATRGSGVLIRTGAGWKIEQYVLSFAVPNDQADAVVEVIRAGTAAH